MANSLEWICAILTVLASEMLKRKLWYGWCLSLANNALWLLLCCLTAQCGLFAMTVFMTLMAVRGLIR